MGSVAVEMGQVIVVPLEVQDESNTVAGEETDVLFEDEDDVRSVNSIHSNVADAWLNKVIKKIEMEDPSSQTKIDPIVDAAQIITPSPTKVFDGIGRQVSEFRS